MDNRQKLIREMLSRADTRLQAQLQIALGSDARAMQFCAACVGVAALIVTLGGGVPGWHHLVTAGLLLIASAFGFFAALPVEWHAPGMRPSAFETDLESDRDFDEVCEELSNHLERAISENGHILKVNAGLLRLGAVVAFLAPILGLCVKMANG